MFHKRLFERDKVFNTNFNEVFNEDLFYGTAIWLTKKVFQFPQQFTKTLFHVKHWSFSHLRTSKRSTTGCGATTNCSPWPPSAASSSSSTTSLSYLRRRRRPPRPSSSLPSGKTWPCRYYKLSRSITRNRDIPPKASDTAWAQRSFARALIRMIATGN